MNKLAVRLIRLYARAHNKQETNKQEDFTTWLLCAKENANKIESGYDRKRQIIFVAIE